MSANFILEPGSVGEVRIAVDVNPLRYPGTGIYRYTYELLKRMCPFGGEWFFYSTASYDQADFQHKNVHHRVAALWPLKRVSQLGQLIYPLWAKRDRIDVFWSPRHQLPLLLSREVRSVVSIHDLVWLRYGHTMRFPGRHFESFLMPRSVRKADQVVALSHFTAAELADCFALGPDDIELVTGASHMDSAPGRKEPIKNGPPYYLFVGTMEPRKNLAGLLRAYRRYLDRAHGPIGLKIVGGAGWGGVDANQMVSQLGLGEKVSVLGRVTDAQLASLYTGAHALVMPSFYEGFGLPVVESLSASVPVIVSAKSAMSEVAGECGIYVDPLSETEICAALTKLSEDRALHKQLAEKALVQSQRYDWGKSAGKMFSLLAGESV
jgi:glycosyltransferase involved in cell wall biosynthesis